MARTIMSVFNQRTSELEPVATAPTARVAPERPASVETLEQSYGTASRPMLKLGKTLIFKGELAIDEDVVLLGRVEGSFTHSQALLVGPGGMIIGDVRGRAITVKGTIEGDIEASELVIVTPSAVVTGNITAPRVTIVEGARFNGSIKRIPAAVESPKDVASLMADGVLSEDAVDQLLQLLNTRRKA